MDVLICIFCNKNILARNTSNIDSIIMWNSIKSNLTFYNPAMIDCRLTSGGFGVTRGFFCSDCLDIFEYEMEPFDIFMLGNEK